MLTVTYLIHNHKANIERRHINPTVDFTVVRVDRACDLRACTV